MSYRVLESTPARRCIYTVPILSTPDPMASLVDAIKVVRYLYRNYDNEAEHDLYGLKNAKDFVESIIESIKKSSTLIFEMDPVDSWRHKAIIGGVLLTLGINFEEIQAE